MMRRKNFKRVFTLGSVFKLFFLSSLATANPDGGNKNDVGIKSEINNVTIVYLTDDSFKQVVFNYEKNKEWKYEGSRPAIVDFYAGWCAPCRELSPIVEEIAKEYAGKIVVYKVDTEKERKLTQSMGISGLPTLLFIPMKGKPQASMGLVPKATLIKAINEVLLVR